MSKEEIISYLQSKVESLDNQLKQLDSEIATLSEKREKVSKALASYKYTLDSESFEISQKSNTGTKSLAPSPEFSTLPIYRVAEIILKDAGRGMKTLELAAEINKRGKSITGPNGYTIVYSSLKRYPELFKKNGTIWTLINREKDTRAA